MQCCQGVHTYDFWLTQFSLFTNDELDAYLTPKYDLIETILNQYLSRNFAQI